MVRVTSLAEKEIHEIGEAFANHNYVDGEKGMYSYFKITMQCADISRIMRDEPWSAAIYIAQAITTRPIFLLERQMKAWSMRWG